ncbi:MAG: ABC transporter permease [Desulfobacterales bacterium]
MTLREIAYRNLMRRKGKAAFILSGLVVGVSTVVAILSFIEAMTIDINDKLEKYGANILIIPKTENLSLTYGGISLGGVSFEMEEIRDRDLERVKTIQNAANIAALGPMVLGVIEVGANRALMAGVDFDVTRRLKPWWKIEGSLPDENGVLLGAEAARVMNLTTGSDIEMKGRQLQVSGILFPTGSQDDHLVFARLSTAQVLFNKEGRISMAEVRRRQQAERDPPFVVTR